MFHDNLAIVRRWFDELWNQRRAEMIEELLTAESVCHADDGLIRGPVEFRERQFVPFLALFPDLRVEIEAMIAQGDEVVVRWNATGTHRGEALGLVATQAPVALRGMTWIRLEGGKLVEGWQSSNISEVLRSLAPNSSV